MWIDSNTTVRIHSDWLCLLCTALVRISNKQLYLHSLLYITHLYILFLSYFLPVLLLSFCQVQKQTKHKKWNDVRLSLEIPTTTLLEGPRSRVWPSKLRPEALPTFTLTTVAPLSFLFFFLTKMGGKDLSGINSRVSLSDSLAFKLLQNVYSILI